jgi:hypothetical protein
MTGYNDHDDGSRGHSLRTESLTMDQPTVAPRRASFRSFLIEAHIAIESLPAMRPRWAALDVALVILLWFH